LYILLPIFSCILLNILGVITYTVITVIAVSMAARKQFKYRPVTTRSHTPHSTDIVCMSASTSEMSESPLSENPGLLGVLHFRAHAQFTAVQHRSKHTTSLIAHNRDCLYVYIKQWDVRKPVVRKPWFTGGSTLSRPCTVHSCPAHIQAHDVTYCTQPTFSVCLHKTVRCPKARCQSTRVNVCCSSRGFLSLTWSLVSAQDDVNVCCTSRGSLSLSWSLVSVQDDVTVCCTSWRRAAPSAWRSRWSLLRTTWMYAARRAAPSDRRGLGCGGVKVCW